MCPSHNVPGTWAELLLVSAPIQHIKISGTIETVEPYLKISIKHILSITFMHYSLIMCTIMFSN